MGIGRFFEKLEKKLAWIVSSDLAHTHMASGPYGFCTCAQPFDDAVQRWAESGEPSALLVDATRNQQLGAASCGFTGLVTLEGMMQSLGRDQWHSKSLANFHPTYYGMMAATCERHKAGQSSSVIHLEKPVWV